MQTTEAGMRHFTIQVLLAATMMLGAGAEPAQPVTALPDFNSFVMMRVERDGFTAISTDQAADALKDFDVIFVGELHDHIANHLAEMALLRALRERVPHLALSMEQFERDRQTVLDEYLAGKIGEETLTDGLGWGNYAEAYRPLIEYAKEHHLPVIAANAPQKIVRCVGREGENFLSTLPPDKRKLVAATLHTQEGAYKKKFLKFMEEDAAHGESEGEKEKKADRIDKSFAAQVARDDTMAESIANFLQTRAGYKVMHVTGSFHAEEGLGTIERLRLRVPNLKIALILPVGVKPGEKAALNDAKGADFAVLLRRAPEPYVTDGERKAADSRDAARFRSAASNACRP
jgi:uncharacterized iron-regulated protein